MINAKEALEITRNVGKIEETKKEALELIEKIIKESASKGEIEVIWTYGVEFEEMDNVHNLIYTQIQEALEALGFKCSSQNVDLYPALLISWNYGQ